MFFCDGAHHQAHASHDHQGEGGPQGPAGHQVKQGHADAPGDHPGALAEEDGGHEEGEVPQVDQPAVGGEGEPDVYQGGEYEHQHQADGGDGNGFDVG